MELRPVDVVPPVDWIRIAGGVRVPTAGSIPVDNFSTLLEQLSLPAIAEILHRVDIQVLDPNPAQAASRMITARLSAAQGDVAQVVTIAMDLSREFPGMAESLRHEPAFQNMRIDVEAAVRATISEIRDVATVRLTQAAQYIETTPPITLADGTGMGTMLAVAMRFYEAGKCADLVRAKVLAERVIEAHEHRGELWSKRAAEWVSASGKKGARLWSRAPLLVLLIGWTLLGITGAISPFTMTMGLLGLVGLGFISGVRRRRR